MGCRTDAASPSCFGMLVATCRCRETGLGWKHVVVKAPLLMLYAGGMHCTDGLLEACSEVRGRWISQQSLWQHRIAFLSKPGVGLSMWVTEIGNNNCY